MLRPNVATYLQDVTFKTERRGKKQEEKRIVVCSLMIQPFTPELAASVDPDVRSELFNLTTGEPKKKIRKIEFAMALPLYMVGFKMAPDATAYSIMLRNARVGATLKVRADKESPIFACNFELDFEYPSADELLKLAYGINSQHFLTFEKEQLDALADAEEAKPEPPKRRGRAKGDEVRPGVQEEFDDTGSLTDAGALNQAAEAQE